MSRFSRRTLLQLALERGIKPGADLEDELEKLHDYSIKSKVDAEAICEVLKKVVANKSRVVGDSSVRAMVNLFQEVEGPDCPAFLVMVKKGIPTLVEIVDRALESASVTECEEVLFALNILAAYGTREGTDAVIRAAGRPLEPSAYMWSAILTNYRAGHPERTRLFDALRDRLPPDFLGISLLDAANQAHWDGAEGPHPFDSEAGILRLEQLLSDPEEEYFSYAVSVTAALPFILDPARDSLLALALDHSSPDVQLQAAWAAATLGREAGIKWLARACLDFRLADKARQYLSDLDRVDAIPPESEDASFKAKAEFSQWLAHPSELGRAPDELTVIDHRELNWPPGRERIPFWLIQYRLKDGTGLSDDDIGVGLVGSATFCFFSYKLEERPPEDGYAIHCYWEMEQAQLITEITVEYDSAEYEPLLRQCQLDGLLDVKMTTIAEPSPKLKYPQRLVGLATATRNGNTGWIVLDGPRSRWYAQSEMPAESFYNTVLMVHVGRVLLGFAEVVDRKKYLGISGPTRSPEQIVAAYERFVSEASTHGRKAKKLLTGNSVIGLKFMDYVSALAETRSDSKPNCTCLAYERLMSVVERAEPSLHAESFDCFAPLGKNFEAYVEALVELDRRSEVAPLVEKFGPFWDHNLGYGRLGMAAFKSGHDSLAASFIDRLRSMKDWYRCDEMNALAEIWHRQGRADEAHSLLIDSLKGLLKESRSAAGGDRRLFEEWYQNRRSAYSTIFPDRAVDEMARHGIPPSTLSSLG
jgi:hypothetical protein